MSIGLAEFISVIFGIPDRSANDYWTMYPVAHYCLFIFLTNMFFLVFDLSMDLKPYTWIESGVKNVWDKLGNFMNARPYDHYVSVRNWSKNISITSYHVMQFIGAL